jgi:hypothetical protein
MFSDMFAQIEWLGIETAILAQREGKRKKVKG